MSTPSNRFELVHTRGGELALQDAAVGEVMHPGLGPIAESRELHVGGAGLAARLADGAPEPVVVFDVGLGAGSNAAAAIACREAAAPGSRAILVVSFEADSAASRFALERPSVFGLQPGAERLLEAGAIAGPGWSWRVVLGDALASLARQEVRPDVIFTGPVLAGGQPPALDGGRVPGRARGGAPGVRADLLHL